MQGLAKRKNTLCYALFHMQSPTIKSYNIDRFMSMQMGINIAINRSMKYRIQQTTQRTKKLGYQEKNKP